MPGRGRLVAVGTSASSRPQEVPTWPGVALGVSLAAAVPRAGRPGRGHVEALALLPAGAGLVEVEGLPPGAGGRCQRQQQAAGAPIRPGGGVVRPCPLRASRFRQRGNKPNSGTFLA